jgi:DNA replication and repair protein RecF
MMGLAPAVLFTATDIDLVSGPPAERRRFLDILISQVNRRYLRSLQRYQRVLYQRNQLLKLLREGRASREELAFWNEELVKEGAFIMRCRREALSAIAVLARERLRSLTSGDEFLEVRYAPSAPLDEASDGESALAGALEAEGERERALGITIVGPHRDDVRLLIDGTDTATYASRGQARTIGLALRLAEAAYLTDLKGEEPILLLDDVLSELDPSRRQQVMEAALAHEQALITTADLAILEGSLLADASIFRVHRGTVEPSSVSLRRRRSP